MHGCMVCFCWMEYERVRSLAVAVSPLSIVMVVGFWRHTTVCRCCLFCPSDAHCCLHGCALPSLILCSGTEKMEESKSTRTQLAGSHGDQRVAAENDEPHESPRDVPSESRQGAVCGVRRAAFAEVTLSPRSQVHPGRPTLARRRVVRLSMVLSFTSQQRKRATTLTK